MRALFVVPHYYRGMGVNTRYASHSLTRMKERVEALDRLIFQIHALFGTGRIATRDHATAQLARIDGWSDVSFDIVICTAGGDHLLERISCPSSFYHRCDLATEPIWLGFAAQKIMLGQKGSYDYYCYLEDDIIIHDPAHFAKLDYFNARMPERCLLLPQRYETPWIGGRLRKQLYTKLYSDVARPVPGTVASECTFEYLGRTVRLQQPGIVHAGCYFLNTGQFELLAATPEFANAEGIPVDRALDLAASNAIGRNFMVFKGDEAHLDFFEVEHGVGNMFDQVHPGPDGAIVWRWNHAEFDFSASSSDEAHRLVLPEGTQ